MARSAVARETIARLRHTIAGIEGRLPEGLQPAVAQAGALAQAGRPQDDARDSAGNRAGDNAGDDPRDRQDGQAMPAEGILRRVRGLARIPLLPTGAELLDRALGGGLRADALTEIHAAGTRDAATAAGFAMALCARLGAGSLAPVLWIGTAEVFHEAGLLYAPGIAARFGIGAERLLLGRGRRVEDVLWIAGEAAGLPDLAAVVVEVRGSPERLDLTATRKLHHRAQSTGRPVFLLRHAGLPQPTAAPARLLVGPAPALPRQTLAGSLAGTIGAAGFRVTIDKNRLAPARSFTLEWISHELSFADVGAAGSQDPGALVPEPRRAAGAEAAAGTVVAFAASGSPPASRHQPSGGRRAAHRGARRTG